MAIEKKVKADELKFVAVIQEADTPKNDAKLQAAAPGRVAIFQRDTEDELKADLAKNAEAGGTVHFVGLCKPLKFSSRTVTDLIE